MIRVGILPTILWMSISGNDNITIFRVRFEWSSAFGLTICLFFYMMEMVSRLMCVATCRQIFQPLTEMTSMHPLTQSFNNSSHNGHRFKRQKHNRYASSKEKQIMILRHLEPYLYKLPFLATFFCKDVRRGPPIIPANEPPVVFLSRRLHDPQSVWDLI